jgi:nucleoside-diphosphate kinase
LLKVLKLISGQIISIIEENNLEIHKLKMLQFSQAQAEEFYQEHDGKPFFNNLIRFMTSGPVVGMELRGTSVVYKWRSLLGKHMR